MMYNNKLVIALKVHGNVLREKGDTVFLPFGSEYSILVKNLNTTRAQVNITVDGQTVIEGLVVNSKEEVEVERFVKEGNLSIGNRLKFIERTASIEQHRGVGIEDGLITVDFQFEKKIPDFDWDKWHREWEAYQKGKEDGRCERWPYPYYPSQPYWIHTPTIYNSAGSGSATSATTGSILRGMNAGSTTTQLYNTVSVNASCSVNDVGITVPGSISTQQFTSIASFPLEAEKHTMVLKLLGETKQGKVVEKPITVKAKQKCITCGYTNKATSKFCVKCGTSLQVV